MYNSLAHGHIRNPLFIIGTVQTIKDSLGIYYSSLCYVCRVSVSTFVTENVVNLKKTCWYAIIQPK